MPLDIHRLAQRWVPSDLDPVERALSHGFFSPVPWWGAQILSFPEPTRIAFAGCWHAKSGPARDAMRAAAAAGAQAVVHTGDFLFTSPEADRLVTAVEEEAEALGLFVLAVRGNHDDPDIYARAITAARRRKPADGFARLSPRVLHAPNGMRWTWSGVTFAALGGAHSVDRAVLRSGVTWWPGEVATVREVDKVRRAGPVDVLVTHDIPAGVRLPFPPDPPTWWDLDGAMAHRRRLRPALEQTTPAWLVGGHLHMRHSTTTTAGPQDALVHVEVLDRIENGVEDNLFIADLHDGVLTPAPR